MAFTERLKAHISLPITFWDERLSTVEAERLLAERGQKTRERRQGQGGSGKGGHRRKQRSQQGIDALAAAVILQGYLDQHPQERNAATTRSNGIEDR
jgi:putative Holliday junction resolvase